MLWGVLLAASMGFMLVAAANKTIIITDMGYGQGSAGQREETAAMRGPLYLRSDVGTNCFAIPLKEGLGAEDVMVENCYMQAELRIYIKSSDIDIYKKQAVWGDIASILSAQWEIQSDGILLRFRMDGIYEYQSSMEMDCLRLTVCMPHDLYRMVVVVDPLGGGSESGRTAGGCMEKEVALAVSGQLQSLMRNADIRLYFTRTEDRAVSVEERAALARAVDADIFINIGVGADEDTARYGVQGIYNSEYFIPEFGNVQMADVLVRNVAIAAKNRAIGLEEAGEESVLELLELPAARVEVGYVTNELERALLGQEEYRKKLAEGIAAAIEEVYGNYYE